VVIISSNEVEIDVNALVSLVGNTADSFYNYFATGAA
jgi:hypothetical protein